MKPVLKTYAIRVFWGSGEEIIVHTSPGKAKSQFKKNLDIPYIDLRVRCIDNKPLTTEDFKRNASYRNIEFAYIGMEVEVNNGNKGLIIGHTASANLSILFYEGKWKNQILHCHPHDSIKYFDKNGEVIIEYN